MFIRKTKSRNSTCFQIGRKIHGKFKLVKHIGCALSPDKIEILKMLAEESLPKYEIQPSLFPVVAASGVKATLSNWHITGFHQVFGHIYDSIGFPENILRDLVIARIVYPKSKMTTIRYLDQYLGIKFEKDKIYRFLDSLDKDKLTKIAYDFVSQKNNGIALIFYDVTTLYFEAPDEDDLRKKGFSKDHKNDLPQIVIGLFVDSDGYPFDFDFYDGDTFEGHTFPKAIGALTQKYKFEDLVVVADAGMLSDDNLKFLETQNLSYIVGARLKGMSERFKEPIFAHNFTLKPIFEAVSQIKLENGQTRDKRLIIDYSDKRAQKDKFNREKIIAKLKEKIVSKKALIRRSKYLVMEDKGVITGIDETKIEQDRRHDGLKGYWTNLKTKTTPKGVINTPKDVIDKYHNLWQVERSFRMSKSDLQERPIFLRRKNRIRGHLLICFCSLLVMKETERILKPTEISLLKVTEILGKVGQGETKIGKITLSIESEPNKDFESILRRVRIADFKQK